MYQNNIGARKHNASDSTPPSIEETRWKGYYPLEECIRMYCPEEEMEKELRRKKRKEADANGGCKEYTALRVNLLIRESLEVHEIEDRIEKRKKQHTKVERRRRELINTSIETLSKLLPPTLIDHKNTNAQGLVLQQTIQYIQALTKENTRLREALKINPQ
ncbi:hypothetical protein DSO57_1009735 [Entomophthora muscae]|uniref:Uncharacterized protein n=1 Tax=Entomophthora muscae TaxID=34485 RepID=A0ACC2USR0_9FUNG|nr:hypothetical protein DSO57_1009735 [Entomophthora muscae]